MRIYLPSTLSLLTDLRAGGETGPPPLTAFAVTGSLREWYADADTDELEHAAFTDAARASLRLLDADPIAVPRRVVVSADVPGTVVSVHPELDRSVVRVSEAVPISQLVSLHVDGVDAEADVRAAAGAMLAAELGDADAQFTVDGAEGHELEWYDIGELDDLLP